MLTNPDSNPDAVPEITLDGDGRAVLSGELTVNTVGGLLARVKQACEQGQPVADVDLNEVSKVDSAGLALLLEWQALQTSHCRAGGEVTHFRTINAPPGLLRLARLCEAVDLLNMSARVDKT